MTNAFMVVFSCASGLGKGRWATWAPPPKTGFDYDIELDIDEPLTFGVTAIESASKSLSITVAENMTTLQVSIEGKDDDGLLYGRLAPDCLIMLETHPAQVEVGDVISVSVPSESIQISPFGSP